MLRTGLWALVCTLCACDDGGGGGDLSFEAVRGVEAQDIYNMTTTADGLFFARTMPNGRPMYAVGDRVTAITSDAQYVIRAAAGRGGPVYFTAGSSSLYRVEGSAAIVDTTFAETTNEVLVDGSGGVFASQTTGLLYRGPGQASFAPVAQGSNSASLAYPMRATDGSLYAFNQAVDGGVLRIAEGGTGIATIIDCNRAELSFCGASARFPTGFEGEPVFLVANVFQESGGEFYRIEGTDLRRIASPPPAHPWILGFTRGPNGDLYVSAAINNLVGSPGFLYVLRGETWRLLGPMPGRGDVAFGGDGTLYTALSVVEGLGGLWIVRL